MPAWVVQYWLQVVFGLVMTGLTAACRHFYQKMKKEREGIEMEREKMKTELGLIQAALLGLLQYRLFAECDNLIARGEKTLADQETVDRLYASYHGFGGNGTGTNLYEAVCRLPYKKG